MSINTKAIIKTAIKSIQLAQLVIKIRLFPKIIKRNNTNKPVKTISKPANKSKKAAIRSINPNILEIMIRNSLNNLLNTY